MNLNETYLQAALDILAEDDFEERLLTLMSPSGLKILDATDDGMGSYEMEIAFWSKLADAMLSPFRSPEERKRAISRYRNFLDAIFDEIEEMPAPEELQ